MAGGALTAGGAGASGQEVLRLKLVAPCRQQEEASWLAGHRRLVAREASGQGGTASGGAGAGGTGGASDAWLGTFKQIDAGAGFTCGVRNRRHDCLLGFPNTYRQTNAPTGTFSQCRREMTTFCGVLTDGTIACWGDDSYGRAKAPTGNVLPSVGGNIATLVAYEPTARSPAGETMNMPRPTLHGAFLAGVGGRLPHLWRANRRHDCLLGQKWIWPESPHRPGHFPGVGRRRPHMWVRNRRQRSPAGATMDLAKPPHRQERFPRYRQEAATLAAFGSTGRLPAGLERKRPGHRTDRDIFPAVSGNRSYLCAFERWDCIVLGNLLVCVPGTNGCASATQPAVCSSRGNSWVASASCSNQTCIAGSCVGECGPNFASCDGLAATTCTADGHLTPETRMGMP